MIDYIVIEGILLKLKREEEAQQTTTKTREWRGDRDHLKQYQ